MSGNCSASSSPIVPCPAITRSSSNACTNVAPIDSTYSCAAAIDSSNPGPRARPGRRSSGRVDLCHRRVLRHEDRGQSRPPERPRGGEAARDRSPGSCASRRSAPRKRFRGWRGGRCSSRPRTSSAPGSFKIRGAVNTIASLAPEERSAGVVAASAGNHGAGSRLGGTGGRDLGHDLHAPGLADGEGGRNANVRRAGRVAGASFDESLTAASERVEASGATFVHAFEDERVIAGQGTIGLELAEQLPDFGTLVVPDRWRWSCGRGAIALRRRTRAAHNRSPGREHLPFAGGTDHGTRSPRGSRSSSRGRSPPRSSASARRRRHRHGRAGQPRDRAPARTDEAARRRCRRGVGRRAARGQAAWKDETVVVLSGGNIDRDATDPGDASRATQAGRFLVATRLGDRPGELVGPAARRRERATSSPSSTTAREWGSDRPDRGRADARDAGRGALRRLRATLAERGYPAELVSDQPAPRPESALCF